MASGWRGSRPEWEGAEATGPVDIAAVARDDVLIDAIAGDGPVPTDNAEEYHLAALLANWRAEVLAEPLPAGPDLDTIVAAVNQEIGARQAWHAAAARHGGGRLRLLRPLGATAAALAVIAGAMTAFSYNAQPGDPLWKFKQVVFSEQANSTIAQLDATTALNEAQRQIEAGDLSSAKTNLDRARQRVSSVGDSGEQQQLMQRWNRLASAAQQAASPTLTTPPTTPPRPGPLAAPPRPLIPGLPTALPTIPSNIPQRLESLIPTSLNIPGLPTNLLRPRATLTPTPAPPTIPTTTTK
jgi:hypothetical protein